MLKLKNLIYLQKRCRSNKLRWSQVIRKKTNIDRALENFDDFYGTVFGVRWKNIRAALLTEHKYVALVNNFGDTEKTCSLLEMDGAINVKLLTQLAKDRIEQSQQLDQTVTRTLGDKLSQIVKEKEESERAALYPQNAKEVSERLQSSGTAHDNVTVPDYIVDAKKGLEQAIEEDAYIDSKRMVDPQFGTGGLYDYVPANKIKGMEDWVPESEYYKFYPTSTDFPLQIEEETQFLFPENLCLYTYEMGNCEEFKPPKKCLTGVLSHFLMDGASILPPLFLDVKHGERVLDACAAPGGKSLLLLQTLHPGQLICNDIQESRLTRIRSVMKDYLFDYRERWEGKRLVLTQSDARSLSEYDSYDKILVDVPCSTDRHSLIENDNNIFKPTRIKERLRIPELQAGILTNCLRLLKPGGTLVYSTCSLSPVQNDGVVHMALQRVFHDYGITATVKDLSPLIQLFTDIFKFENPKGLKYGQMVLPYLPANFGPMYFSKITRN
ncbi:5-methylcytosine rRNA methyltransferase NSUN4 [Teleopsis dalmanni]|uniref:5-methylcytosine rRNA methyltransferase NSUN4 n=1 Tax=Teleopsis dalmanni TaxID=139649 RepID=UPI0018CF5251|nr:5-methylcytosine rRNA methyltransferase NSUN4 [Teleopsis dalmanni]